MTRWACWAPIVTLAAISAAAQAAALEFDFKDPKGVNTMYFVLDSEIEPIMGLTTGISGKLSFDPADAKKTTGRITVAADSIQCANKQMTQVLQGADWLNVKERPEVVFTFKEIKDAKTKDNTTEMTVLGEFECNGVKKEITIPVSATLQKGQLENRLKGQKGDLLVLRTEFKISRKDFNIKQDMGGAVVAEDIQIRAAIVGMCPAK